MLGRRSLTNGGRPIRSPAGSAGGRLAFAFASLLVIAFSVFLHDSNAGRLDIEADWLAVRSALDGTGAHATLRELSERHGALYTTVLGDGATEEAHPRTPGAFVVLAPLAVVPAAAIPYLWGVLSGLLLAIVAALAARELRGIGYRSATILVLVAATPFAVAGLYWGTQSVAVGLLLAVVPFLLLRGSPGLAGSALAVAAVLKLYPLALGIFLLRYPRALLAGGAVFVGLNLAGILLPGVSLSESLHSIAGAPDQWFHLPHNASAAGALWQIFGVEREFAIVVGGLFGLAGVVVAGLFAFRGTALAPCYFAGLAFALLAAPNTWIHYDLALLPTPFIFLGRVPGRWILPVGCVLVAVAWIAPGVALGPAHTVARLAVGVGVLAVVWRSRRLPGPDARTPT